MDEAILGICAVIIFLIVIGAIAISVDNWHEKEECRLMEVNNFETKILYKQIIKAECYVRDESINKFVPYDKFRAIGG